MCHPGQYDQDLERAPTRLKSERDTELKGLMDSAVRDALKKHDISLIDFRQL